MRTAFKYCLLIVVIFTAPLTAGTITSVNPDIAHTGEGLSVTIYGSGTHFLDGGNPLVWLSKGAQNIYASGYNAYSNTALIVWFDIPPDAATGWHHVNVYNDIDGIMTLYNGFVIRAGIVTSVNPDNAQQGQEFSVIIIGQNTNFSEANDTVWFSQGAETIYSPNSWSVSDTLLIAEFDIPCDACEGLYDVKVQNSFDGTMTLSDGLTITPFSPEIASITPRGAYQGQSLSVTITGLNTHFVLGEPSGEDYCLEHGSYPQADPAMKNAVWLSRGDSTIFSKDSWVPEKTLLTASFDIPADANTGLWDVHVPSYYDGVLSLPDSFMVVQPGDWTGDGMVNFFDLAILAENWLEGTE